MENKKKGNYLSIKESRAIIKYNIKQMKYYEALKKKKLSPEEYTSVMKDHNNIVEIDNLQTNFFTDNGTVKSVNGVSSRHRAPVHVLALHCPLPDTCATPSAQDLPDAHSPMRHSPCGRAHPRNRYGIYVDR